MNFRQTYHSYLSLLAQWAIVSLFFAQLLLIGFAYSFSVNHSEGLQLSKPIDDSRAKEFNRLKIWQIKGVAFEHTVIANNEGKILNWLSPKNRIAIGFLESFANMLATLLCIIAAFLLCWRGEKRLLVVFYFVIPINHYAIGLGNNFSINGHTAGISLQFVNASFLATLFYCYRYFFLSAEASLKNKNQVLLAYASQSGTALQWAKKLYHAADKKVDLRCISKITPQNLEQYRLILFVASTYGDGEAPELAIPFINKLTKTKTLKNTPEYSILALGDKNYQNFCAFGHQLHSLLLQKGAIPINSPAEVDQADINAIQKWWQHIASHYQWQTQLQEKHWNELKVQLNCCLNPTRDQRFAHCIELEHNNTSYQPGDLLEVLPLQDEKQCIQKIEAWGLKADEAVEFAGTQMTLLQAMRQSDWPEKSCSDVQKLVKQFRPISPRTYSIASAPHETAIRLLVRAHIRPDGSRGLASSYLCHANKNDLVKARIKSNANFHPPKNNIPIIMIAAGTGLAPFIGFLKHEDRRQSGVEHWLFFGEQFRHSDYYFESEIGDFQKKGLLTRVELAWSRDSKSSRITDNIVACKGEILSQVEKEAASIYVCGSKQGFGEGVSKTLREIFGEDRYISLLEKKIIRTDLY